MAKTMLKKILVTGIFILATCIIWLFFMPAKVVRVDNHLVYLDHVPITNEGKINWWKKNKEYLQEKHHLIKNPESFTVVIMRFGGYKSLPTGSNDGSIDDYHCFDDIKNKENCIYNDAIMIISGNLNKKIFYGLDNKIYSETPDGKLTLLKE